MTDLLDLALTYGGFTSLDKVYLEKTLNKLSPEQQLIFITPPPSVINAYFAEHYQKNSSQAAVRYFYDLSVAFDLFQQSPTFAEDKPFVRLNLSGRSLGFCFVEASGLATVFTEDDGDLTDGDLLDIAELFPQFLLYREGKKVYLKELAFDEAGAEEMTSDGLLLTTCQKLADGTLKLSSYNKEELLEAVAGYDGHRLFGFSQRQFIGYVLES